MADKGISNTGRILISIFGLPIGALFSAFITKVLDRWGVLDGLANGLGDYLKANVDPDGLGLVFGLLLTAILYGFLLWKVWRPRHIHHGELSVSTTPIPSLEMEVIRAPREQAQTASLARQLKDETGVEEDPDTILDALERVNKRLPAAPVPPPLLFAGFVDAKDTPQKDHTAIRVNVRNQSNETLTGLVARLVRAEPPLGSLDGTINLPLVLETKARLDRLRNPKIGEQPPQQGFDLHPLSEKQIEVLWLHSRGALEGYITHQDGEASFLFVESVDFHIEVTGVGEPITAVVRLTIDYDNSQEWTVTFIAEAAGAAHGKGSFGQKEALTRPPFPSPSNALKKEVSLAEAMGWAVYGEWGQPYHAPAIYIPIGSAPNPNKLLQRFTQLAREGKLTMWGKRDDPGYYQKIPQAHWQDNALGIADMLGGVVTGGDDPYRTLMLNKAEVEREWPHEG